MCFDDFHRLASGVVSVLVESLHSLQLALKSGSDACVVANKKVLLLCEMLAGFLNSFFLLVESQSGPGDFCHCLSKGTIFQKITTVSSSCLSHCWTDSA